MPDPSAFTFPTLKQYVPVKDLKPASAKVTWKKGQLIHIDPDDFRPYIAARLILPLSTAIREGIYEPDKPTKKVTKSDTKKTEEKASTSSDSKKESDTSESKSTKDSGDKKLIENKLREAVQDKKKEIEEEKDSTAKIDKDKLEAIKSGGKK